MWKTAAISDRQRTRKPLVYRHLSPATTTDQAPDRLCKQEVAGSIPAGSIFLVGKLTVIAIVKPTDRGGHPC
jgi:hypothetical protein